MSFVKGFKCCKEHSSHTSGNTRRLIEIMSEPSKSSSKDEQKDAAEAWRAQRAQKSCLHSDKPVEGKDSAAKWHPLEATWRVATLPFKIAHNTLAANWRERTRPTWSTSLDKAVSNLRTYSTNSTLSMAMIRRWCISFSMFFLFF